MSIGPSDGKPGVRLDASKPGLTLLRGHHSASGKCLCVAAEQGTGEPDQVLNNSKEKLQLDATRGSRPRPGMQPNAAVNNCAAAGQLGAASHIPSSSPQLTLATIANVSFCKRLC